MLGYYRDKRRNRGGRSRRLVPYRRTWACLHPDGYLEIRDRAKDIIISGGENISSVEVEAALASHPAVLEGRRGRCPERKVGRAPRRPGDPQAGA